MLIVKANKAIVHVKISLLWSANLKLLANTYSIVYCVGQVWSLIHMERMKENIQNSVIKTVFVIYIYESYWLLKAIVNWEK